MRDWPGIAALRTQGEKLAEALAAEQLEVRAGHKATARYAAIWRRFDWIPTRDTFEAVREERDAALLPEQRAGLDRVAAWVASSVESRASADLSEQIVATEAQAHAIVHDERIDLHSLSGRVKNAADRGARAELYAALEGQWRSLTPLYADALAIGREAVQALPIAGAPSGYTDACSALYGFDLRALARAAQGFLARTDDLFRDSVAEMARRAAIPVPVRQLAVHDLWALFRLRAHDGIYHPADLTRRCLETVTRMGLDPLAKGRIRLDLEDRPGKNPRACCIGLRVPTDVVVVCRPRGGAADWGTFLHELGHALHRANTSGALPFEDRRLGDNSVTEGWATVLERVAGSRAFLERVLRLPRREAEIPCREIATADLFIARRHAAKLAVEIDLHDGASGAPDRYATALSRASTVPVSDARWAADVDVGLYAARYLRAWQLEALAFEVLRDRFDDDWFVNPRTGAFLAGLWSLGQSRDADQIATEVFGAALDMDRLARRFEARLA